MQRGDGGTVEDHFGFLILVNWTTWGGVTSKNCTAGSCYVIEIQVGLAEIHI